MARATRADQPTVYNRLSVLRSERNLSRQDIADAIGVHYQTISYLERGEYNPSLAMAMKIAKLFELPIEAIFSFESFKPMSTQLYSSTHSNTATSFKEESNKED